jgi:DNA-binding CsgD family transcriptional regulator
MLVSAGQRSTIADIITRSLALVPSDSREAGYLLSRYGEVVARVEGDYYQAQEPFSQALTIARHIGDVALERTVLAQWANTDHTHLRQQECREKCLRIIELSRVTDEPYPDFIAHFYATAVLGWTGELESARRHAAALLALSEKFRHRLQLASALWRNEMVSRLSGDWPAARVFSDRALAIRTQDPRLLSTRVELEYQTGEYDQGNVYLERLVEVMRQIRSGPTLDSGYPATVICICARIAGVYDCLDLAESAAKHCLSSASVTPLVSLAAKTGLALLAVLRNDVEAAREGYRALESRRGTMLPPSVPISADRLLGLLCVIMDRPDQAVAHFESALFFCRKAGYLPELAWSLYDYADCLLANAPTGSAQTDASQNRQKAISLLEEALAICTELGMLPLMERVVSLQEKARLHAGRAPQYPDGLTEREVEVLRLVATGKRDREIAEALFISVTTVSTHVRNILNKINAANRTEATAYAAKHGLG